MNTAKIEFTCWRCSSKMWAQIDAGGMILDCPSCHEPQLVPAIITPNSSPTPPLDTAFANRLMYLIGALVLCFLISNTMGGCSATRFPF